MFSWFQSSRDFMYKINLDDILEIQKKGTCYQVKGEMIYLLPRNTLIRESIFLSERVMLDIIKQNDSFIDVYVELEFYESVSSTHSIGMRNCIVGENTTLIKRTDIIEFCKDPRLYHLWDEHEEELSIDNLS